MSLEFKVFENFPSQNRNLMKIYSYFFIHIPSNSIKN
jgi:hypothetical protein